MSHLGEPYTSSRSSRSQRDDEFGLGLGFFIARTYCKEGGQRFGTQFENTELVDGAMPGGACVRIEWSRGRLETAVLELKILRNLYLH